MKAEHKQRLYLVFIMVLVALGVGTLSLFFLYKASFEEKRLGLITIAQSWARMMEAVARFDSEHRLDYPGGYGEATLAQFREAHQNFEGFGETDEYTLARLEGDQIIFVLRHRHSHSPTPTPTPTLKSTPLKSTFAEPMRRALRGESGSIVGLDYRGETVLAAYEPVDVLNLGLVAKVDLYEIRIPFFRAGFIAGIGGIIIITIGAIAFFRASDPLIRSIRESEERYRSIFEAEFDAIILLEAESKQIVDTNKAACGIFGYDREEFMELKITDISAQPEETLKIIDSMVPGKFLKVQNRLYRRKDGTVFPVEISAGYFHLNKKKMVFGVLRDVTEKQKAEEKLKLAQNQALVAQKLAGIGELAAGISHEVLNPVNIISVDTQMLQRKSQGDSKIQTFCTKVRHEIDRIQKIMGSLLEFAREGSTELEKGVLREDIEKVLALVEEEFKLDNIKIERNWCSKPIEILYDPDKIRQVFLNLINNAKHAMPEGGTITVGCALVEKSGKQFLQLTFSDTGTGMNEEVRLKIFDPFFTTKPEGEGTGMGLSVVHGIIEEHGGKIRVESEKGKGTTFIISLPIA